MKIHHADYSAMLPLWAKVRDVVAGEEAVKAKGVEYLPMLGSQREAADLDGYENYKRRAQFWEAAARTKNGLVGAVTMKPPTLVGVEDAALLAMVQKSPGRNGESLASIAQQALGDLVSVSRGALLVDRDATDDPDAVPYMLWLPAESLVFWAGAQVGGRTWPKLLVFAESYDTEPESGDSFGATAKRKTQFRALRLGVPSDEALAKAGAAFAGAPPLVYWQEIWREREAGTSGSVTDGGLQMHAVMVPRKAGGRFWEEIPCDVVNAIGGIALDVERPQMLGLANILLSHYMNSADLEWGRHMCAIPQPWVAGFQMREGERLVIGCGYAWATEETGASANYLEFSGAGLGHIAEGMKAKEQQAAAAGARMLEMQQGQPEAYGTVRLRQAGERSVLVTIATNASDAITRAVRRMLQWVSPSFDGAAAENVAFALSTDFDATQMDPAELQALTAALQAGTISWETFAFNMRRGEMLPPGVTDDQERERIQAGSPGRSRKDSVAVLQADVSQGRLGLVDYFALMQDLGHYEDRDPAKLAAAVEEEKQRSVERQMEALAARMVAGRSDAPQSGDGEGDPA